MSVSHIYIVRHGETSWNAERRIQGDVETDLNETGRSQALALKRKLSSIDVEAIISSTLGRAIDTIRPLADLLGKKIQTDDRLKEIKFGVLEGKWIACFTSEELAYWDAFWNDPLLNKVPGGETFIQLSKRVASAYDDAMKKYQGKNVLFVGHMQVNRVMLAHITGLPLANARRIRQTNDEAYRVDLSPCTSPSVFRCDLHSSDSADDNSWHPVDLPFSSQ